MTCPHCSNADKSMIELLKENLREILYLCSVCGKTFLIVKK